MSSAIGGRGTVHRALTQRLRQWLCRLLGHDGTADEQLRLTNARLELLNGVSQALNSGATLLEAIQGSCDGLKSVLGYQYVELFLPAEGDADGIADAITACTEQGFIPLHDLCGSTIGRSRVGRVYDDNHPVEFRGREEIVPLICDLAPPGEAAMTDLAPRIYEILGVDYIRQVPLLCEGELMGHLAVGTRQRDPLPEREKRFLQQFAEQLALIVAKARAEQALRISEQRYRLLFSSGNDAMYVQRIDDDGRPGRLIEVNNIACEMLGYEREQLLSVEPTGIAEAPVARFRTDAGESRQAPGRLLYQTSLAAADGRLIPVEVNAHLFELDGRPAMLSIARDVTLRRQTEERLRCVNECFIGFGADPVENIQRLTALCGEALAADWAGYARDEADRLRLVADWHVSEALEADGSGGAAVFEGIAANGPDFVAPGRVERLPGGDADAADVGTGICLVNRVQSHSGTSGVICVYYREEIEPSEEDEWLIGIIAAAIGVEEERRLARDQRERAMVDLRMLNRDLESARREAEEANRLKSEFLANTSHEIRTPLNGIIGYLQLVINELYDTPEEAREFLLGAQQSAEHLLTIINDVLDIARIEAGKMRLQPGETSIVAVLDQVQRLVRVQADEAGLQVEYQRVDDELTAWCDEERLRQVLLNLIGNAVKFTPAGGRVAVGVQRRDEEGDVRFEIRDTGIGISPDKLEAIFCKFVQADGSTTRRRGGSGLGLTISRHLVELMGGALGGDSDGEGKGSVFFFTVPLHRGGEGRIPTSDGNAAPVEGHGRNRPLALVVEDDPLYRDYLCGLLEQHGFVTTWAATADDALLVLKEHVPRIVTIDYSLPARESARLNTGWDLLVELQRDERLAHTVTVIVTGDGEVLLRRLETERLPSGIEVISKLDVPAELPGAIERALPGGPDGRHSRILVADDDPHFRLVLGRLLEDRGHELLWAKDGEECLRLLEVAADTIDLLLLDLRMPTINGYEVLERLHQLGSALPVLIVTAFPEPETIEERMMLSGGGLTRLLTKHEVLSDPGRFCELIEHSINSDGQD